MSLNSFIPREFIEVAVNQTLPVLTLNMIIFFMFYKYTDNASVVDIGQIIGHFLAGLTYAYHVGDIEGLDTQLKLLLLALWTYRLSYFLWKVRIQPRIKDPRMEAIFNKFPPHTMQRDSYVLFQYLFQGIIVLMTSSCLYWVFKNQLSWDYSQMKGFRLFNYAALFISLLGIVFEGVADSQLQRFKDNKEFKEGTIFQEGLWSKSRHPNLFFDSMVWFAFACSGVFGIYDIAAFGGPLALQLVMDLMIAPSIECEMKKSVGDQYVDYKKKTHKYWPF